MDEDSFVAVGRQPRPPGRRGLVVSLLTVGAVLMAAGVLAVGMCGAADTTSRSYPDAAAAEDEFGRGWLRAQWVPASATAIAMTTNIDTNRGTVDYEAPLGDVLALSQEWIPRRPEPECPRRFRFESERICVQVRGSQAAVRVTLRGDDVLAGAVPRRGGVGFRDAPPSRGVLGADPGQ